MPRGSPVGEGRQSVTLRPLMSSNHSISHSLATLLLVLLVVMLVCSSLLSNCVQLFHLVSLLSLTNSLPQIISSIYS